MNTDQRSKLQIPQGTEGFSLSDAYRHRRVVRLAEDLFTSWGFLPAQLPVFDFFDSYRSLLDDRTLNSIYRLMDREGDLLMLRSDMTLFLAKQIGAHTDNARKPIRVCYADAILRHQESEDISHNEFFQLGAELIGVSGLRGDIEMAALLGELFSLLRLPSPVLHIGSRSLFDAMTAALSKQDREHAASLVLARQWTDLRMLAGDQIDLLAFIGSRDEFVTHLANQQFGAATSQINASINELSEFVKVLEDISLPFEIRIDLSEIGVQHYYTGCVFSVYVDGVATAVASGGRYDDLLQNFGSRRPAVGFSLMLRKVMNRLEDLQRFDPPSPIRVTENNLPSALKEAARMRTSGRISTL